MSELESKDASLLAINSLCVSFKVGHESIRVLENFNLVLNPGEKLAILGESGSGKTALARAILGILDANASVTGEIHFQGENLLTMSRKSLNNIRGSSLAMIFQDSMSSLNPVYPVGWQISELLRVKRGLSKLDAKNEAIESLNRVGIKNSKNRYSDFPHQFSGGMRQRASIALALAMNPKLLIADEPTTALDVTVQAQILELIDSLVEELDMALILITHNLGIVAQSTERIIVLYSGKILETGETSIVLASPAHPYTRQLLMAVPAHDRLVDKLSYIPFNNLSTSEPNAGCIFSQRCDIVDNICKSNNPELVEVEPNRIARCHFSESLLKGTL
jgi:oligopeptide transport system ATP-binding protein